MYLWRVERGPMPETTYIARFPIARGWPPTYLAKRLNRISSLKKKNWMVKSLGGSFGQNGARTIILIYVANGIAFLGRSFLLLKHSLQGIPPSIK